VACWHRRAQALARTSAPARQPVPSLGSRQRPALRAPRPARLKLVIRIISLFFPILPTWALVTHEKLKILPARAAATHGRAVRARARDSAQCHTDTHVQQRARCRARGRAEGTQF
jgi:hypothetical protein